MNNILYTIAVLILVGWAIGYFAFNAGGIIHILFVIALITVLLRIISGNKIVK